MSAAVVVRCVQAKRAVAKANEGAAGNAPEEKSGAEVAFYRKYTEGMLRRYMYRSMEIGRVPSLLGDFSFRGRSSHRRGYTFEDAVIFVHDVERCIQRLDVEERELIKRIALQEYTQGGAAELMGLSLRTVGRRYPEALDRLTRQFLRLGLMQIPGAC